MIFSIKLNKNKIAYFDYIRVIATIFLIITHSIMMDIELGLVLNPIKLYLANYITVISLTCNVMFLFLSGALLLPYKEEKISTFYYKRFLRLAIPMLVYYLFYMYVTNQVHFFPPAGFKKYLSNILTGKVDEAPHLWILYRILAFYIICPFLRIMLHNMKYKTLQVLILVSFICMTLNTVLPYFFHVNFVLSNPLNDVIFIPVYGYFFMQEETKNYYNKLILLGILSFIITAILCKYNKNFLQICSNASPIAICMTALIFILLKFIPEQYLKINLFVYLVSKYSFSIVLIHWFIISAFTMNKLNLHATSCKLLALIPATIVSLFASLLFSIIMDNTIIKFIYFIIDKINLSFNNFINKKNLDINN